MAAPSLRWRRTRNRAGRAGGDGGEVREQEQWRQPTLSRLPISPSGRVPKWVLDEVVGHVEPADPWRSWSPTAQGVRRSRRQRAAGRAGGFVLVVALGALGAVAAHLGLLPGGGAAVSSGATAQGMPHPTPGRESADAPLGTPLSSLPVDGEYAFVSLQADGVTPVAYDPCRPIHFVIRPDNAPFGGEQLIQDAVSSLSQATGLVFVYDGPTDENPS